MARLRLNEPVAAAACRPAVPSAADAGDWSMESAEEWKHLHIRAPGARGNVPLQAGACALLDFCRALPFDLTASPAPRGRA
jgi:hypothetical protein